MTCKGTADVEINSPLLRNLNWQMQPEVGQAINVDLPTCIAQFDSMKSSTCSVRLVKMMEKGCRKGTVRMKDAARGTRKMMGG